MPDYLTTSDAARRLNRAAPTILYYERVGKLPSIRTEGGMRLFALEDVECARRFKRAPFLPGWNDASIVAGIDIQALQDPQDKMAPQ